MTGRPLTEQEVRDLLRATAEALANPRGWVSDIGSPKGWAALCEDWLRLNRLVETQQEALRRMEGYAVDPFGGSVEFTWHGGAYGR